MFTVFSQNKIRPAKLYHLHFTLQKTQKLFCRLAVAVIRESIGLRHHRQLFVPRIHTHTHTLLTHAHEVIVDVVICG